MRILLILSTVFFCKPALALIEVRANAGLAFIDSGHFNKIISSQGLSAIYAVGVYGLDAIIQLPGTGLLMGLRYDWQGVKVTSGNNEAEISATRYAALLGYRWNVVGPLFLGGVCHYGLSHSPKSSTKINGTSLAYDTGDAQSAGGALEIGVKFGVVLLSAEIGMQSYLVKNMRNSSSNAGYDLNLGSTYARGAFGLGF